MVRTLPDRAVPSSRSGLDPVTAGSVGLTGPSSRCGGLEGSGCDRAEGRRDGSELSDPFGVVGRLRVQEFTQPGPKVTCRVHLLDGSRDLEVREGLMVWIGRLIQNYYCAYYRSSHVPTAGTSQIWSHCICAAHAGRRLLGPYRRRGRGRGRGRIRHRRWSRRRTARRARRERRGRGVWWPARRRSRWRSDRRRRPSFAGRCRPPRVSRRASMRSSSRP